MKGEGDDLVLLFGLDLIHLVAPLAGTCRRLILLGRPAPGPAEFVKFLDVFLNQRQELLQIEGA